MVTMIINGAQITTSADSDLLSFLRNDMGIKSVKDGCNEGACGTCKVLIDGVSKNACTQKIQNLDGKIITTVDGFTQYEKDVYVHCFTNAGQSNVDSAYPAWSSVLKDYWIKILTQMKMK